MTNCIQCAFVEDGLAVNETKTAELMKKTFDLKVSRYKLALLKKNNFDKACRKILFVFSRCMDVRYLV